MLSGFNMLSPTPYRCFLPLMTPFSLLDRSKDHQILLIEYSNDRCLGKPEEMEGMLRNGTPDIFVFGTNLHHSKVRQVLESKGLRSEVCGVQVLPPPRDVEFVYESADEYPFYLDSLDYYCSRLTQIADPKSTKLMFNLQQRVESSEYQDFDVLNERAQVLLGTRYPQILISDVGRTVTDALWARVDHREMFTDPNHMKAAFYMPEMQVLLNYLFSDGCQHDKEFSYY
jgi:hypothetical protein